MLSSNRREARRRSSSGGRVGPSMRGTTLSAPTVTRSSPGISIRLDSRYLSYGSPGTRNSRETVTPDPERALRADLDHRIVGALFMGKADDRRRHATDLASSLAISASGLSVVTQNPGVREPFLIEQLVFFVHARRHWDPQASRLSCPRAGSTNLDDETGDELERPYPSPPSGIKHLRLDRRGGRTGEAPPRRTQTIDVSEGGRVVPIGRIDRSCAPRLRSVRSRWWNRPPPVVPLTLPRILIGGARGRHRNQPAPPPV